MADALDELRGLERRDAELSAFAGRMRALDGEVAGVRARAEEIEAFFAAYSETDNRLRKSVLGAETELTRRRREYDDAQAATGEAKDEEARESAERRVDRARDHVLIAEARVARATEAYEDLERHASALTGELSDLAARAERVTRHLPNTEVPESTPQELIDWAGRAHATLFVASGQADAQRDRIVREANELATMLLGEPTYGSTPAQALARVEGAETGRSSESARESHTDEDP